MCSYPPKLTVKADAPDRQPWACGFRSTGVAISSAKNVTEYHAVALVSTRRVIL